LRNYELLFIISPQVADHEVDGVIEQVKNHLTDLGTTITKVENLGRRKLAYEINHFQEGTYALIQFQSQGAEISELERRLRVMDHVLRYLTVRLDRDLRRMARMKRKRERRRGEHAQAGSPKEQRERKSGERKN